MASIINAVSGSGITQTADGSGVLKIQSNSVTTNALAWVNFNGTGTVAIRSSYNVSSITDNGAGDYTVNFATALSDANYVAVCPSVLVSGVGISLSVANYARTSNSEVLPTTTAFRFSTTNTSATAQDTSNCYVAIFGN